MTDKTKDKAAIAIEFEREVMRCVDGLATAAIDGDAAERPDRLKFVSHIIGLRDAVRLAVVNCPLPDTDSGRRTHELVTALDEIGEHFGAAVRDGLLHQLQKVPVDGRVLADIVNQHLMPIEQIVHDVLGAK